MKPIEGEPAFPSDRYGQAGLSERRYYIGQALMGFCTNTSLMVDASFEATAAMAIQQADAVMSLLYPQPKETNQ